MKYLKRFEGQNPELIYSEKDLEYYNSDVYQDLKDICLELKDDGFGINFQRNYRSNRPECIKIFRVERGYMRVFNYREVKEVVERIKEYMLSKNQLCKVKIKTNAGYEELFKYKYGKVVIDNQPVRNPKEITITFSEPNKKGFHQGYRHLAWEIGDVYRND